MVLMIETKVFCRNCRRSLGETTGRWLSLERTTLLEHGADVKAQDAEGKTALFYAVDEGHDEVAEILRNRLR